MNYILGSASPCLVYSEWGLVQQSRVGESVVAGLKEINKKKMKVFHSEKFNYSPNSDLNNSICKSKYLERCKKHHFMSKHEFLLFDTLLVKADA